MDESVKKILSDAAELILKKYDLKLNDVDFIWYDISTAQKHDFMLSEVKINGVFK